MIPLASWLKNDLHDMVEDLCSEQTLRSDGLFDPRSVRQLLNEHFENKRDHRKIIWALLAFQTWKKNYGVS